MRIGPSPPPPLPIHIARAYGVSPARAALPLDAAARPMQSSGASRLVAGYVRQPVSFDGARSEIARDRARDDALPLYTRAADKMEAALGVKLGRKLDVRG